MLLALKAKVTSLSIFYMTCSSKRGAPGIVQSWAGAFRGNVEGWKVGVTHFTFWTVNFGLTKVGPLKADGIWKLNFSCYVTYSSVF